MQEISKAISSIEELLKKLPSKREQAGISYGIVSNLAVIESSLNGISRVTRN